MPEIKHLPLIGIKPIEPSALIDKDKTLPGKTHKKPEPNFRKILEDNLSKDNYDSRFQNLKKSIQ